MSAPVFQTADAKLATAFGLQHRKELPPCPEGAFLLGAIFLRLGGFLSIDSNGRRYMGRPCYLDADELPQLPDAEPRDQFHSREEWEGAIKLVEGMLRRLCNEDVVLVYDALAQTAYDPRKLTPSIEEPRRA